jgi:hypothetical protein
MSNAGGPIQYPEGKNDSEGLLKFSEYIREYGRTYRYEMERAAMGNILTYIGLHWIRYDTASNFWRPILLKKRTPRPITNKFAAIVSNTQSRLLSVKPPLSINATSTDVDDLAAAAVGDKLRQIIERESRIREIKPHAAAWLLLTGNVFYISNYDLSMRSGEDFITFDQCLVCQQVSSPVDIEANGNICPKCGESDQFTMAVDERGKPVGFRRPRGRHYTEIKSLFDCDYDYEVPMIEDSPYFIVRELQSYEWVKQTYGKAVADKAPLEQGQTDRHTYFTQALAYTSSTPGRYVTTASAVLGEPRIRVTRLWFKPSDSFPEGIYAVLLGDREVAESLDLPYHTKKGDPFVPIVHTKFDHVPGRVYGKTRADDIRHKQFQRNRLEAILELHSRRMANSLWLLPDGVGVSRLSGEQGQFLRYSALAGVPAPTRVPGDNPPPYLMDWMFRIDAEMDDLFGSKEILRGEVPEGVSAYAAIALIDERARQGQSSLMENWTLGWMKWTMQNLDIWREYAETERVLSAGFGAWEIEKFSRANFQGGVEVDVETGESRPTTAIARRAALEQAARTGAFNVMDPMERYRYLEALGVPELMEDFKLDLIEVERENDGLAEGHPILPPMPWQNHALHIARHRRFIMSDKYRALPPPLQSAVLQHMMEHQILMSQAMMQLRPGQAVPGPAGGSGGTAKGDQAGTDAEIAGEEAQLASPDTFTGGSI